MAQQGPDTIGALFFLPMGRLPIQYTCGLLLVLVAAVAVYVPGLSGGFLFDDYPNITENRSLVIQKVTIAELTRAIFSSGSGPLMRPVSMLSLALNRYYSGLDPFPYLLTNVIIHALAAGSVAILSYLILKTQWSSGRPSVVCKSACLAALFAAAAWALHPLNLTSVLYIVQRMTSLSAVFALWALIAYVIGRLRMLDGKRWGWAIICGGGLIFGMLSVLSKETGALIILYMLVTELTIFRFRAQEKSDRTILLSFFGATVLLPILVALTFLSFHPSYLSDIYGDRPFTPEQRVLTEARIVWLYIRMILFPDITQMALYHDDITLSTGLVDPVATAFAVVGHVAVLGGAVYLRSRAPMVAFGILWFYFGHALESTVFALEIMHEHRNYLPMIGPLVAVGYYVLDPCPLNRLVRTRVAAGVAFVVVCAVSTGVRAAAFGDIRTLPIAEANKHPESARANYEAGRLLANLMLEDPRNVEVFYSTAAAYLQRSVKADDRELFALFGLIQLSSVGRKPPPSDIVPELRRRLESHVPPLNINYLFRNYYHLLESGKGTINKEDAEGIFRSALQNPRIGGHKRAHVMTAYALYMLNLEGDRDAAITLLEGAIKQNGDNPEFHVVLAALLFQAGRDKEAGASLSEAENRDRFGYMKADIRELRQAIAVGQGPNARPAH